MTSIRNPARKLAGLMLLACTLAWSAAGCGTTAGDEADHASNLSSGETREPASTPTVKTVENAAAETPGSTAQPAPSGLTGLVIAASDVSGRPDTPLPDQAVIAIPEAAAAAVLGLGSTPTDEQLRFLKSTLQSASPQMGVTVTDAQGRYSLALPAGTYILCIGEENTSAPARFPLRTRGCGRTVVPAEGVKTVDISSGFGEILLVEP